MLKRLRFKQTETFEQRLSREAAKLRKEAQGIPVGIKRERLIQRARQAERALRVSAWLSSPACKRRNGRALSAKDSSDRFSSAKEEDHEPTNTSPT